MSGLRLPRACEVTMGRRILLIDDSAMLRRIAANILHAQPGRYEVTVATRATEGFALACVGGVDLILLDYLIAGLADTQLCRRLLADARTARIPTILMVGQGVKPPSLASLPLNVVDTLAKPFAPEQLSGVVNGILGSARTHLTLRELRSSLHPDLRADPGPEKDAPAFAECGSEPPHPAAPVTAQDGIKDAAKTRVSPASFEPVVCGQGDTTKVSLRTVMQTIAAGADTGVLQLWPEHGEPTEVHFDQGRIVIVSTRNGNAYATHAQDVMPAKVSPATLEEAIAEQNASGTPFLLTLGTRGLLSKASAVSFLEQFGQRQFARLWPMRAGRSVRFEFRHLDALPQYALRLEASSKPLDEWLLESARYLRSDDTTASLHHEGSVGTPVFQTGGAMILKKMEPTPDEALFLNLVNGRTDLPTIAKTLGITPEAAYTVLSRFRCLDVLGYRTAPAAFVMTPRTHLRRVLPLKR